MPIIGTVEVWKPTPYLKLINPGTGGYIDTYEIIVTPLGIFVSIYAVFYEKEVSDEMVYIKRIGPGLTADDFEINFLKSNYSPLLLSTESLYFTLMNEQDKFIVFPCKVDKMEITFQEKDNEESQSLTKEEILFSLRQAESDLDQSIEEQNFEMSSLLRNQIADYKRMLENKR